MLERLFGFLRGPSVKIQGVDKLPEGEAKKISIGDPLAGCGAVGRRQHRPRVAVGQGG